MKKIGTFHLIIIILFLIIFIFAVLSVSDIRKNSKEAALSSIEDALIKASVECYAIEGSYPDSLEYLKKYGIKLDNERYYYYYEIFASNIPPIIKVESRDDV